MRISAAIFVILISACIVNASVLDPVIENIVHLKATKPPGEVGGIWKKKTVWKPRWVKEWKSAKVTKPVWRKVWSPIQIREWLPIPKPPPGWDAVSAAPLAPAAAPVQPKPLKDSQGHDSFPAHSATAAPLLWDPVPYPESQQPPPPPPFPQPLQSAGGSSCGTGGCDNTPSHSFNQQQILEILGPRYLQPGEYFQNPEYSETVNHLTRLPPEGNNWRAPPPLPDFHFDNRFNGFPGLPEFLIPPKTQIQNDYRLQPPSTQPITNKPPPIHPPELPRWNPISTESNQKGHFVTTKPQDQPYRFEFPELRNTNKTIQPPQNQDSTSKDHQKQTNEVRRPPVDGDFIQEAQLVGEYHYSEFDLPGIQLEQNKLSPQPQQQQQQQQVKPQQKVKPTEPQKPTANQQPVIESKPKPAQKDIKPPAQNPPSGSHIQKKHISTPPAKATNHHFQQQAAFIKEIFPIFKPLPPANHTLSSSHRFQLPAGNKNMEKHSSTKLAPHHQSNSTNFQQQKQVYPVYERPQGVSTNHFPPNHRFPSIPEHQQRPETTTKSTPPQHQSNSTNTQQHKQHYPVYEIPSNHRFTPTLEQLKPFSSQNSTKLVPVPPAKPDDPAKHPLKPDTPLFDKASIVQLVFATAPDEQPKPDHDRTTTTEPYEIVFSSSLLSTTEAVTKSPAVMIVTPINSKS